MNKSNRLILTPILLLSSFFVFGQRSVIPDSTMAVAEINLPKILKQIPLEEFSKYTITNALLLQLPENNTKAHSLSELGLNFESKPVLFYGEKKRYSFNGIALKLKDKNAFQQHVLSEAAQNALTKNNHYIDELAVHCYKEDVYVKADLTVNTDYLKQQTDAIFDENDWEKPYFWFGYNYEQQLKMQESIENEAVVIEDATVEEPEENPYKQAQEAKEKRKLKYLRIMDSLREEVAAEVTQEFIDNIKKGVSTFHKSENFVNACKQSADLMLFSDVKGSNFFKDLNPYGSNYFLTYGEAFLNRTWQTVYFDLTETGIKSEWKSVGEEGLISAIDKAGGRKFDKELLKYIPNNQEGFMVLNINGFDAYKSIKEHYMPKLDASDDSELLLVSAVWSLIDEITDAERVFDMYGANMFFSYNGARDMEVTRMSYEYNEENFEYSEEPRTEIESIPLMTFGLSSESSFVVEKFMKAFTKMEWSKITKEDGYYTLDEGPIPGVPFYLVIKGEIVLFTNDVSLTKENRAGYGKQALSGNLYKSALKSEVVFAHLNTLKFPEQWATFSDQNPNKKQELEAITKRMGTLEVRHHEVTKKSVSMVMEYTFSGNYQNGAYYLMDIIEYLGVSSQKR